jgi:hypothetical protein
MPIDTYGDTYGDIYGADPGGTPSGIVLASCRATVRVAGTASSIGFGPGSTPAIPTVIPTMAAEIAFSTDPLSTSPVWTDVTAYVILQEGELQISRGATDEFQATQPGTLTGWLDNSDGRFTRGRTASPYYPNVKNGKRIRLTITQGSTYQRYNGHVNNWPTAWKVAKSAAFPAYIPVSFTAVDRFDRMNKRGELRSIIEEEFLRDITGAELLEGTDGTFENSLGNWSVGGGISAAVASTEQARTGSYSMKLTANGTGVMWTKNDGSSSAGARRVKTGEKISIGGWVYSTGALVWRVVLRYGDSTGAFVTQENGSTVTITSGKWSYVSFLDRTVPASVGTVYAQIETTNTPTNGTTAYVDDMSIRIGSRPAAYFPLGESSNSQTAGNAGPYQQGALAITSFAGDGEIDFGSGTGPGTDELSAPMFLPTSPTAGGKYLSGELYNMPGGVTGLTLEAFFRVKPGTNTRDITALETAFGRRAELSINSDGTLHGFTTGNNAVANYHLLSSTVVNSGGTYHAALTEHIRGSTVTARLYRNGIQVATTTYTDSAIEQYKNLYVGGEPVGGQLFEGTISHVAAYSTALPASRIAQHAAAGLTALIERTDQRLHRIADWIGIPMADRDFDIGDSTVGWQGTSGQQAIGAMQECEATEGPGSAFFVAGDGKLTFHAQTRRINAPVFITLDATDPAQVDPSLEFPGDDFALFNDVTGDRPREGQVRWTNDTSIREYGLYRTSVSTIHAYDNEAAANVQWIAENYGTPRNRVPNLICNLYDLVSRGGTTWLNLVTTLLQTEISKKIRIINLPDEAPVSTIDVFVEGTVETIGVGTWTLQFYCSPADFGAVWQLGISGASELGLTTILGL